MSDSDKVNINISIAGENLPLSVPIAQQDLVRETEKNINALYDDWRRRYPKRTQNQLLAMMAYQYASFYLALTKRDRSAIIELQELENEIDRLLKPAKKNAEQELNDNGFLPD